MCETSVISVLQAVVSHKLILSFINMKMEQMITRIIIITGAQTPHLHILPAPFLSVSLARYHFAICHVRDVHLWCYIPSSPLPSKTRSTSSPSLFLLVVTACKVDPE